MNLDHSSSSCLIFGLLSSSLWPNFHMCSSSLLARFCLLPLSHYVWHYFWFWQKENLHLQHPGLGLLYRGIYFKKKKKKKSPLNFFQNDILYQCIGTVQIFPFINHYTFPPTRLIKVIFFSSLPSKMINIHPCFHIDRTLNTFSACLFSVVVLRKDNPEGTEHKLEASHQTFFLGYETELRQDIFARNLFFYFIFLLLVPDSPKNQPGFGKIRTGSESRA